MASEKNSDAAGAQAPAFAEGQGELARAHSAYVEARYRHAAGQLRQTHTLGNLRRARARAQTVLARRNAAVGQEK